MSPAALRDGVRTLYPGYFALVMATGIVSIALAGFAAPVLSAVLLWVAAGAYALVVWSMYKSMVKNFDMTIRKQSR